MVLCADLHYFTTINSFIDLVKAGNINFQATHPFRRSTFRNRMMVPASNGIIQLSIPLVGGRNCRLPYRDVLIDYKSDWQRNHYQTLVSVYGNAPWFQHYSVELEALFDQKPSGLFEWNMLCFYWIAQKFKMNSSIRLQETEVSENEPCINRSDFYLPSNYSQTEKGPFLVYAQVFDTKIGFKPNLSILDLLLNEGPNARNKILSFIN
jgi:hypothetical protein